jgi:hypothetical protein
MRNMVGALLRSATNLVKVLRGAHPVRRLEVALKVDEPELDLDRSAQRVAAFSQLLSRAVRFGIVGFDRLPMYRPQRSVDCEMQRLSPTLE